MFASKPIGPTSTNSSQTTMNQSSKLMDENKIPAGKIARPTTSSTTTSSSITAATNTTRQAFGELTNKNKQTTTTNAGGALKPKPLTSTGSSFLQQQSASTQNVISKPVANNVHPTEDGARPSKVFITDAPSVPTGIFAGQTLSEIPNVPKSAFEFQMPSHSTTSSSLLTEEKDPMEVDSHSAMMLSPKLFLPPSEPVEDIDANEYNPQFCSDYVQYIFSYLKKKEALDRVPADYMNQHVEINSGHRTILIDWLSDVSQKFKLLTETLFLTVYIMDKYLSTKPVARKKLQLIGTTAMLIAAKYEEIYTPEVKDYAWITGHAYPIDEFIKMEKQMLVALDFNISTPTALHFLRRFSRAAGSDGRLHTLSKYIIEVSMLEYSMLKYPPSQIAAAAVFITRKMTQTTPYWNSTLKFYTGFAMEDILQCAQELNELVRQQKTAKHKSIFTKYAGPELMNVAELPCWDGLL